MFKKNWINFILMLVGLIFVICGFYIIKMVPKEQSGIMFGLGSGLFGIGLAGVIASIYTKRNPNYEKIQKIELNDERNKFLRYKTNSTIHTINYYLLAALSIFISIAKLPLWLVFTPIGIIVLNGVLYIFFFNKFNKKM